MLLFLKYQSIILPPAHFFGHLIASKNTMIVKKKYNIRTKKYFGSIFFTTIVFFGAIKFPKKWAGEVIITSPKYAE